MWSSSRTVARILHASRPLAGSMLMPAASRSAGFMTSRLVSSTAYRSQSLAAESQKTTGEQPVTRTVELLKRNFKYTRPTDITPLKEAHSLYATIHMYDRKFLVTEGDKISIPVSIRDVAVGDVLDFDQVSVIGSRDYTLTGNPRIDRSVFSIKGVVIEKTRVKRKVVEKTKPRRRHTRHIVSKNALTVIRVSQLTVNPDY